MRTNIKVSIKETVDNPNYNKEIALEALKNKLEYTVPKTIESVRGVDILLSGDTAIVQDIIAAIPGEYTVE